MAWLWRCVAVGVFLAVTLTAAPPRSSPRPGSPALTLAAGPPAAVPMVLRLRPARLPAFTPARQDEPTGGDAYVVTPGDTLWAIARRTGSSVAALAAANHLVPGAVLKPGLVVALPPAQVDASSHARRARMLWPTSGTVTSRFGWRIHPIFGTREFHAGLDIATRWGAPVLASRAGIVRFAGWMTGYGRLIIVDHGHGLETLYSHLSTVLVAAGQRVAQGATIGRIGSTGWSTGPHLLFEVRKNGVPQDPARYLR